MWNSNYTYAALLIGSILFPLLFSFEKNIRFIRFRKPVFWAVLIPGIFFIIWDVAFTRLGFWSFNPEYTLEPRFLGLPLEEWLFFVVIPYCSLFVYEVLNFYLQKLQYNRQLKAILFSIAIALLLTGIMEWGVWYTSICLTTTALFLFFMLNINKLEKHLTHFTLAFVVACMPMFIVNGVLTAMPVVEYNTQYFSNFRIGTIPAEDFSYFLLLFSMNFVVYEKFKLFYKQ